MAEAYIYDQDCKDFANIGLCGRLSETLCEFEEVANGMAELTMEHPIDDDGRYLLLTPGRIIKASVPVRNIPELDDDTCEYVTSVERWYVRNDATKLQRSVYNKRDDQVTAAKEKADSGEDKSKYDKKRLRVLKKGTKVTVLRNYGDMYPEYRIRVGKTTGYIDKTALRDKTVYTYDDAGSLDGFYERHAPSWRTKEQLFRIYSAVRDDDKVVVHARHIFFDNTYTLTTYENTGNPSIKTVLNGIESNRCGQCLTDFHTNIKGTRSGAHYENKNIVEAILDPDEGVAHRWGADVIRDNYDCYLINGLSYDRGTTLEYGHDLLGVEYDVNWENVVTHVRPVGETSAGKPLYLTSNKGMVVSPNASNYPFAHVAVLKVSEAKVRKDVMTTAEARAKLQSAADELLAAGCDQPQIGIKVEFTQLGETEEYAEYKNLKQMFLFDMVRVYHKRLNIKAEVQVVRVVWDCRLERMKEVELGSVRSVAPKISSFQIGSVSGSKLSGGSVSAAALDDDSITTRHLQAESVNSDAIQARSITAEKLAVGAVDAQAISAVTAEIQNITAATIGTNLLTAAMAHLTEVVATQIQTDLESADDFTAALAHITTLFAGTADFDLETVRHLIGTLLDVATLNAGMAQIRNLYVTQANLLNATMDRLTILAADGETYYDISVGSDGQLYTTVREVSQEEADAGVTDDGRQILDGSGMQTDIGVDVPELDGVTVTAAEDGLTWLTTQALSTGKLRAVEAFIGTATIPRLEATTLEALGHSLNLLSNETIQLLLGTRDDINNWFSFTENGMIVRKTGSKWSTVTAADGFHINHDEVVGHVGSFARDRLFVRGFQIGDMTVRPSGPNNTGGWVWSD